jgi:hypothetical protein
LQLIYRTPDGAMKERLLGRSDEVSISVATVQRAFTFDLDAAFQLTCEAKRIDLAFLFDPMRAVHTSSLLVEIAVPTTRCHVSPGSPCAIPCELDFTSSSVG